MAIAIPDRSSIQSGMQVEINPQRDRTRKQLVIGIIKDILTKTDKHPHGILVELESGEKGRVKKIVSSSDVPVNDIEGTAKTIEVESARDIASIISRGENHFVEFKSSILWSVKFTSQQIEQSKSRELKKYGKNASKFIIAKSIAGFLNSDGGDLIIGIKENKDGGQDEVIGVESEFPKLKDKCIDGYRRMIIDQIVKQFFPTNIFNHINQYMQINFEELEGKMVCGIHANKSDTKVFISYKNEAHFFVRIDASTREISGEDVVDYCMKRFS